MRDAPRPRRLLELGLTAVVGMAAVITARPFISFAVAATSALLWCLWLERHPQA